MTKIRKSYRFNEVTINRIADLIEWLPAEGDTHAIEECVGIVHTQIAERTKTMDYKIEVTTEQGSQTVEVCAPNQRDAHLLAAREATGEMEPPAGTETRIVEPVALAGGMRRF